MNRILTGEKNLAWSLIRSLGNKKKNTFLSVWGGGKTPKKKGL